MCPVLQTVGPHAPHPAQPEVTRGTEHAVLQDQRYRLRVLALTTCVRQAKDYTQTQRRSSSISQGRRTRRCTGKVQNHGDGEGIEGVVQRMRPSDPTQVPWDVPFTRSPSLDEMMASGFPRPPGQPGRPQGGLPPPLNPGQLQTHGGCYRFAGLAPSQAAAVYVVAGRFTFYHLIK